MTPQGTMPHSLRLEDRKKLTMTGVTEVVSFDDESVVMKTELGLLIVQGHGLQLKTLTPEGGQIHINGTLSSFHYEEPKAPVGWLRRLFQ